MCLSLCINSAKIPSDLWGQTMPFCLTTIVTRVYFCFCCLKLTTGESLKKTSWSTSQEPWCEMFIPIISSRHPNCQVWAEMQQRSNAVWPAVITMCSASAAVCHRVRPRCSFAKTCCSCSHSLFAAYIIYHGSVTRTHVFHSTSMCHVPGRNIQSNPEDSEVICVYNVDKYITERSESKAKFKFFAQGHGPLLSEHDCKCLTNHSLSAAVSRLMFSQRNSGHVFSISVHFLASQSDFSALICLWSAAQESQQDCNFLCNSAVHLHIHPSRTINSGDNLTIVVFAQAWKL